MELETEYAVEYWWFSSREGRENGHWAELDTLGDGHTLLFETAENAQAEIDERLARYPKATTNDYRIVRRQISDWEVVPS